MALCFLGKTTSKTIAIGEFNALCHSLGTLPASGVDIRLLLEGHTNHCDKGLHYFIGNEKHFVFVEVKNV